MKKFAKENKKNLVENFVRKRKKLKENYKKTRKFAVSKTKHYCCY